jgi:excinuclease ABC subunit C
MMKDLRLNQLPRHIECFDNSNFQGKYPVSAIVVFKDAKPSKKDYRHFNVKTVEGPNDFATMEEAVYRRYKRLLEEGEPLPQLVIIDGGKGQLSAALKSLKLLGIENQLTVIGIAKRLEELFYPGDQYPLYLDKRSESLKIIQQLRDEAHRFGITFHRLKRNKGTLVTELDRIPGIGKTTSEKLLKHFKSVKRVREASEEELRKLLNKKQMEALKAYFEVNKKAPAES